MEILRERRRGAGRVVACQRHAPERRARHVVVDVDLGLNAEQIEAIGGASDRDRGTDPPVVGAHQLVFQLRFHELALRGAVEQFARDTGAYARAGDVTVAPVAAVTPNERIGGGVEQGGHGVGDLGCCEEVLEGGE